MNGKRYDTTVNFMVTNYTKDMIRAESIRRWRNERTDWRESDVERDLLNAGLNRLLGQEMPETLQGKHRHELLMCYQEAKAEREELERAA